MIIFKRGCVLLALLLLPLALRAQTPEQESAAVGDSVNYVFATDLGSGVYDLDGRTLQIYRYTYRKDLREVKEDQIGFRFVLPITVGFFDFNPVDVVQGAIPTRVDSFSVVPGIEMDYLWRNDWHVVPYLRAGFSVASSSVDGWLYGAGVRLERNFELRGWDAFARMEAVYSAVAYRDPAVANDHFERIREAMTIYHGTGWEPRGHEVEFGFYGIYDVIIDPPQSPIAQIEAPSAQFEAGVMFGTRPAFKVWKFDLPRLGFGYRSAGELSGWRFVIAAPF